MTGVLFSVLASCVFGVLYLYSSLLQGLDPQQVFGWRIVATLPFIALFAVVFGDWKFIVEIYQRLKQKPLLLLGLMATSILGSLQLWLFMWGPIQGRGLQVSLGYFLLPLVMVLIGRVFLKEELSRFQTTAVIFATIGVAYEIYRVGQLSWETWLVALGYAAYFWLRKAINTNHLGGFFWDLLLILPIAFYFISTSPFATLAPLHFSAVMLGFGALSALGLGSYILASRYLSFSLFGLLSYLEPVLLATASFMLGEKIAADEWLTYILIWCAVAFLAIDGYLAMRLARHKNITH